MSVADLGYQLRSDDVHTALRRQHRGVDGRTSLDDQGIDPPDESGQEVGSPGVVGGLVALVDFGGELPGLIQRHRGCGFGVESRVAAQCIPNGFEMGRPAPVMEGWGKLRPSPSLRGCPILQQGGEEPLLLLGGRRLPDLVQRLRKRQAGRMPALLPVADGLRSSPQPLCEPLLRQAESKAEGPYPRGIPLHLR